MSIINFKRRLDKLGADGSDGAKVYFVESEDEAPPEFRRGIDSVCDPVLHIFADPGKISLPSAEMDRRVRNMMARIGGTSRTIVEEQRAKSKKAAFSEHETSQGR